MNADINSTDADCTCVCKPGFVGDGLTCTSKCDYNVRFISICVPFPQHLDIDECDIGLALCGLNAACRDTIGSYQCVLCDPGYISNGTECISMFMMLLSMYPYRTSFDATSIVLPHNFQILTSVWTEHIPVMKMPYATTPEEVLSVPVCLVMLVMELATAQVHIV